MTDGTGALRKLLRAGGDRRGLIQFEADAAAWHDAAERLRADFQPTPRYTEALFDLLTALPAGEEQARDHLRQVRDERGAAVIKLGEAVQRIRAHDLACEGVVAVM